MPFPTHTSFLKTGPSEERKRQASAPTAVGAAEVGAQALGPWGGESLWWAGLCPLLPPRRMAGGPGQCSTLRAQGLLVELSLGPAARPAQPSGHPHSATSG